MKMSSISHVFLFTKIFKESRKNIYSELRDLCENLSYEIVAKITDTRKEMLDGCFSLYKLV